MPYLGGSIMTEYETLKRLVAEADEDVQKAIGGNKAAGTRVRKKMQEIKAAAQEVRKKVLEGRETEPGAAGRVRPEPESPGCNWLIFSRLHRGIHFSRCFAGSGKGTLWHCRCTPKSMPPSLLFDIAGIDLERVVADQEAIRRFNPQRGDMEHLNGINWFDPKGKIVGYKDCRPDEFWVPGHIPGRPLLPGVLMIESAAQLASYFVKAVLHWEGFIGFGGVEDAISARPSLLARVCICLECRSMSAIDASTVNSRAWSMASLFSKRRSPERSFPNEAMFFSLLQPLSEIPVTVIDVETTGISPEFGDRVIELGIVRLEGGEKLRNISSFSIRTASLAGISALTGITQQMLIGQPKFGASSGSDYRIAERLHFARPQCRV